MLRPIPADLGPCCAQERLTDLRGFLRDGALSGGCQALGVHVRTRRFAFRAVG